MKSQNQFVRKRNLLIKTDFIITVERENHLPFVLGDFGEVYTKVFKIEFF